MQLTFAQQRPLTGCQTAAPVLRVPGFAGPLLTLFAVAAVLARDMPGKRCQA